LESIESSETFLADYRAPILVENRDFTTTDEEAPFALDAVIKAGFTWR
jgi:hypothetical protein